MAWLMRRLNLDARQRIKNVALLSHTVPLKSSSSKMKVTVFGDSGDLVSPLALLLHQSPRLDELAVVGTTLGTALARQLNALDNRAMVEAYPAADKRAAEEALRGARVVILADEAIRVAGEARRPRILRHAKQAAAQVELVARHCPQATVLVLTAPISGVVPVVVEAARRAGVRCPERRVLGVPAVAKMRAASMVGALLDEDPHHVTVPITGGTSASAAVPLLSQVLVNNKTLTKLEIGAVLSAVQTAGAKMTRLRSEFAPLPALGVAYAAARFTDNVVSSLLGEKGVQEHAFVACDVMPSMPYLTAPVELQAGGAGVVRRVLSLGPLTGPECAQLRAAARLVQRDLDVADELLRTMFDDLLPDDMLRCAPVSSIKRLARQVPECPTRFPRDDDECT